MSARKLTATVLVAASVASTAGVASAAPMNGLAIRNAVPSNVETVQLRRWGWPVAGGLVAGAIVGSMLAAPYGPYGPYGPYYGPGPYYVGPGPYYPAPYVAGPVVRRGAVYSDAVAYCMRRYRSYDPRSGTFLGYDGLRHPCP
ncbi:MAG: BA14K family protein [Xanthobacteraceae bacterium]|nr:BA14K family protein [Xanthobacteraceae bacterium]